MCAWTNWRKIADKKFFYDEEFDYDGPACYELALGGPRGGIQRVVYVGETNNESRRMLDYSKNGSHLKEIIDWHVKRGWSIYYRAQGKLTKEEAVKMQNNLLKKYKYDWNIQLNLL